MASLSPPPINDPVGSFTWLEWYRLLQTYLVTASNVPWSVINKSGSNLADLQTRDHNDLTNKQGGTTGEFYHLTQSEYSNLGTSSTVLILPANNLTANGPKINTLTAGESITRMNLVRLNSSGKWVNAEATSNYNGLLGVSLETKSLNQAMSTALLGSFVRDDDWGWSPNDILYIGTSPGEITTIAPSSPSIIRVIGFAVTADIIYFNPSPDYFA